MPNAFRGGGGGGGGGEAYLVHTWLLELEKHLHTCAAVQIGQQADEETQNWLDNMMSNTVNAKANSGSGTDLVSSSKTPKPKPGDRAMRKTLIMRTGTSEVCSRPGTLFGRISHFASLLHLPALRRTVIFSYSGILTAKAVHSAVLPLLLSCLTTSGELRR